MEAATSKRGFIRHFLALSCTTAFLTIVPMVLYGGLIVWSGDLGGPLNLIIIPIISALIGFGVSLIVFMPVSLVAESSSFRHWLTIVGGLLVALTAVVVLVWIFVRTIKPENRVYVVVGSVCLYLVGGFFVYLCCLGVGRRLWPPSSSRTSGATRV
jgi:hypothetical protein